jgi:MFS family permease
MFFFVSLYTQGVLQYSPLMTGISFLPIPIVIGISSTLAPRLVAKVGFKPLLIAGTTLLTIGTFLLSFISVDGNYFTNVLPGLLVMALGAGVTFVSISVAATSGVPSHEAGLASGLLNTSQQMGGALGLAILSGVAAAVTAAQTEMSLAEASVVGYRAAFLTASCLTALALFIAVFVIRKQSTSVPAKAFSLH